MKVNNSAKALLTVSFMLILICCSTPKWIKKYPLLKDYYIGVGSANKDSANYIRSAKDQAISDLASSISLQITSIAILEFMQNEGLIEKDEFYSMIKTKTELDLTGIPFELVDTWENKKNYYVYYRLKKSEYDRVITMRRSMAVEKAREYFRLAEQSINDNKLEFAIANLVSGYASISRLLGHDLSYIQNGHKFFIDIQILSSLITITNSLVIHGSQNSYSGKFLGSIDKAIRFTVEYQVSDRKKIPATNLPFSAEIEPSGSEVISTGFTDQYGNGIVSINKILSNQPNQKLTVKLSSSGFNTTDNIDIPIKWPEISFNINVRGEKIKYKSMIRNSDFRDYDSDFIKRFNSSLNHNIFDHSSGNPDVIFELNNLVISNNNVYGRFNYDFRFQLICRINNLVAFSHEANIRGEGRSEKMAVESAIDKFNNSIDQEYLTKSVLGMLSR